MDVIDRLTASQVEEDDTIRYEGELIVVDTVEDDGEDVTIEGFSLTTGYDTIITVPFETVVDLMGS